jgi:hypothetical protein
MCVALVVVHVLPNLLYGGVEDAVVCYMYHFRSSPDIPYDMNLTFEVRRPEMNKHIIVLCSLLVLSFFI